MIGMYRYPVRVLILLLFYFHLCIIFILSDSRSTLICTIQTTIDTPSFSHFNPSVGPSDDSLMVSCYGLGVSPDVSTSEDVTFFWCVHSYSWIIFQLLLLLFYSICILWYTLTCLTVHQFHRILSTFYTWNALIDNISLNWSWSWYPKTDRDRDVYFFLFISDI